MRRLIGAVAGIAAAVTTVMAVEWVAHAAFAGSGGSGEDVPFAGLLLVALGYMAATFDGILVAALVARGKPAACTALIAVLMLAATVSTLLMIPHPVWFQVLAPGGICAAAVAGWAVSRALLVPREAIA